jgi:uncharacterized membrane protein
MAADGSTTAAAASALPDRVDRDWLRRTRTENVQLRVADAITRFAGWMLFAESSPWPTLTLVVSLEAIFLSTFVMIGQNRAAAFQQAKANHDFVEQETELKTNTQLTREIHVLTTELHRRVIDGV